MQNNPRRLYLPRRSKFPPNTKAIDRRSDWGNPYIVGSPGVPDRETAVQLYECDLLAGKLRGYRSGRPLSVDDAIRELRGFDLVCSGCPDDGQPCHGTILLRIANQPEKRCAQKPESAGQK